MNTTNRALNRILLLIIGLGFLVVGAAVVAVVAYPPAGSVWTTALQAAGQWLDSTAQSTAIAGSSTNLLAIGLVAAVVVILFIIIVIIASVGHRRKAPLLRSSSDETPLGRVTISESFASDAVTGSLRARSDIVASSVTSSEVKGEPVMHVSVTPRRNTSPRVVAEQVDKLATNLASLTGHDVPTYISLHAGFRAKLAPEQTRVS